MSDPLSQFPATDCLFTTILGFMPPFHLAGVGGKADMARTAIMELNQRNHAGDRAVI
jgi:hypothetical protein